MSCTKGGWKEGGMCVTGSDDDWEVMQKWHSVLPGVTLPWLGHYTSFNILVSASDPLQWSCKISVGCQMLAKKKKGPVSLPDISVLNSLNTGLLTKTQEGVGEVGPLKVQLLPEHWGQSWPPPQWLPGLLVGPSLCFAVVEAPFQPHLAGMLFWLQLILRSSTSPGHFTPGQEHFLHFLLWLTSLVAIFSKKTTLKPSLDKQGLVLKESFTPLCSDILAWVRGWGSCDWGGWSSNAWGREQVTRTRVVEKAMEAVLYRL